MGHAFARSGFLLHTLLSWMNPILASSLLSGRVLLHDCYYGHTRQSLTGSHQCIMSIGWCPVLLRVCMTP